MSQIKTSEEQATEAGEGHEFSQWLREEQAQGYVRIRVDEENNAEAWWTAAQNAIDVPAQISSLVRCDGPYEIVVPAEDVPELRAWCEVLPGWCDGPAFAPTALVFSAA